MPAMVGEFLSKVSNDNFKQKILNLFISNYLELLDIFKELSYTIELATLINVNQILKKSNPKIMPYVWRTRFGGPFSKQLKERDIMFFADNDCSDVIINSMEFSSLKLKETCLTLVDHYRKSILDGLKDEAKTKIINKLLDKAILVTNLAEKYIEIDK